jgi:hypothetical protein
VIDQSDSSPADRPHGGFGLPATGGVDYGWNSFEKAINNSRLSNTRRK